MLTNRSFTRREARHRRGTPPVIDPRIERLRALGFTRPHLLVALTRDIR